ncbi:MAG: hypothetical protein HUK05_04355 [Prevotella sp.]|nr:hypothetical protein [Prevotella sp.]
MKKIFTLIAAAFMAASASAQTELIFSTTDQFPSNAKFTQGPVTMTLATSNTWAFKENKGDDGSPTPRVLNGHDYLGSVSCSENPKVADGTGAYATFTSTQDGLLYVACVLNASKKMIATADGEALTGLQCYAGADGNALTIDNDATFADKFYGEIAVPVVSGKAYIIAVAGSKAGYYGFRFEGSNAINNINANQAKAAALVNIAGQKVGANYKGLVIKNGVKTIIK